MRRPIDCLVAALCIYAAIHSTAAAFTKKGDYLSMTLDPGDTWIDGRDLLNICTSSDSQQRSTCAGYVIASADAYNSGGKVWRNCIARGTDSETLIAIVVAHLRRWPVAQHHSADALVGDALQEAFPCPAKR